MEECRFTTASGNKISIFVRMTLGEKVHSCIWRMKTTLKQYPFCLCMKVKSDMHIASGECGEHATVGGSNVHSLISKVRVGHIPVSRYV
jgi:hypothetical protein